MHLPYNFGGLNNQSYKKAKVVVLPISLEKTVSYMPGTKFGPRAIINASRYIELFDIEMGRDLSQIGIFTLPELLFAKNL